MLNLFGKKEKTAAPANARRSIYASDRMPIEQVADTMRQLSIGKKVEYFPEFKRDVSLETVVLGYAINGYLIFSSREIQAADGGTGDALVLEPDGEAIHINSIESFFFIIPFNPDDESKIDYGHRAEIGRRGIFGPGNNLTLTSREPGGRVRMVDTMVVKQRPLKSGPYANYQVVFLDVVPDSIVSTDRRKHHRLKTNVAATLLLGGKNRYDCTVMDYSGDSIRLGFSTDQRHTIELAKKGQDVVVEIKLEPEHGDKRYLLTGFVLNKDEKNIVITIRGTVKDGKRASFGIVEMLDLKANLIEHPATHHEQ